MKALITFAILSIILLNSRANADLTFQFDADLSTPGIQESLNVTVGEFFTIDFVASDALGLSSFGFGAVDNSTGAIGINDGADSPLVFDSVAFSSASAVFSTFLPGPFAFERNEVVEEEIRLARVIDQSDSTNSSAGASSSNGTLFSLSFRAEQEGSFTFGLDRRAGGGPLTNTLDYHVVGGSVTNIPTTNIGEITINVSSVPEPSLVLLFAPCIGLLLGRQRKK
ncbi:MAG: hypothetical protein AAGA30_00380 [Planctomycetota bacterium]